MKKSNFKHSGCLPVWTRTIISVITICLYFPFSSFAQHSITGIVTDSEGTPLPLLNVVVKGTAAGVLTNDHGVYSIEIPKQTYNPTLVFSFIGYSDKEEIVGRRTVIDVSMASEISKLDEVVVVGFGTQKKVNVLGAIATVDSKELEARPISNVSSALAGLSSGVSILQPSGRPGSDGATIRIRGTGTMNNNNPMVLIDGIVGTMDAVNPDDIASISVLKDAASSAIFGSRAANGVILITTKKGKSGKANISYSGLFSISGLGNTDYDFVSDYVRYMKLVNEASNNVGGGNFFTPETTIAAWEKAALNPGGQTEEGVPYSLAYPNTDWMDVIFENNISQIHNLAVNGGNDKTNYLLSFNYLNNPGIMQNTGSKRYQMRVNLETKLADYLTVGTQTFASLQDSEVGSDGNAFNFLRQTSPGVVPFHDGYYGAPNSIEESTTANNILVHLNKNIGNNRVSRFNSSWYAVITPFKGFSIEPKFNYQLRQYEGTSYLKKYTQYNFLRQEIISEPTPPDQLTTTYGFNKDYSYTGEVLIRYNKTIGNHEFGGLLGYQEYYYRYYNTSATKKGLLDYDLTTFDSATEMNAISGSEVDYALRSFFGRINYAFKSKYLFEANVRYDGSSRFHKDNRWGVFPSFSLGWRLTEEAFMDNLKHILSNAKIRASWGKLGNQQMSSDVNKNNYDYQATYGKINYSFNGLPVASLAQSKIPNSLLKWETTIVSNLGLETAFLRNRLTAEIEVYNKKTEDILTTPSVYLTLGTKTAPTMNTASMQNKGIEITVGWQDKIGDFSYSISGNFSFNKNKVTTYRGKLREGWTSNEGEPVFESNIGDVSSGGRNRVLEDYIYNEFYLLEPYQGDGSYNGSGELNINGGPKDGMIRTPEDMKWVQDMMAAGYKFMPDNKIGKDKIWYGDLIYADVNGDKIYGNSFDKTFTNTSKMPRYTYGLNLSAAWKNIDFSMIWAGSAGMQYYFFADYGSNSTLRHGCAVPTMIADNHYFYNDTDPNDPRNNIHGKYPRVKTSDKQNSADSRFWLYNASFLKIKNLQVGYTIPKHLTKKILIERARIFYSGENLWTFTSYPGIDPEVGDGFTYPTMRQHSFGINITF